MDTVSAVSHCVADSSLTMSVANELAVSFGVFFNLITRANLCSCASATYSVMRGYG